MLLLLVLRIDRLEFGIRSGLACPAEFHNVEVTLRELLEVGGGVALEKAIDPLTPSESKVGLLDLLLALLLLLNPSTWRILCFRTRFYPS